MSIRRAEHNNNEIERCRTELQTLGRPRHPSQPYTIDTLTEYIDQLAVYVQSTRKGTEEKEDAIAELLDATRALINLTKRMRPAAGASSGCG